VLADVETYTVLKFFHVLLAIVWIGGAVALSVMAELVRRQRAPGRMAAFARDAEWLSTRLFLPSSLIVFALGFWLVSRGHWGYHFWIVWAIAAFAASFVVGAGYIGPQSGKLAKQIDAEGAESPAVEARTGRILLAARADIVILISIVFMMVTKVGQ
jgi:uncharacterized membrane protein